MGRALYRSYRSKSLKEVVGQEHITTALQHALEKGTISHAYLFTGPRGVGKTSVARILAHAVNNLPYPDESNHLDIIEIDAASNRRIDEIRELRDKVHITPTSAKYKVYIIDEVHMLTREAFNALLKTLEEPPEHVIFILATTEAHKLPETIISRTQRFTFKPIKPAKAVEHLRSIAKTEKIAIDDDALELIAQHGGGSFRDSIGLLDQARNISEKITTADILNLVGAAPDELIDRLVEAVMAQDAPQVIIKLQDLSEQGFEPGRVAKQLAAQLRSQLIANQLQIPATQVLKLLASLIEIPASRDQAVALEIALLGSVINPKPSLNVPEKPKTAVKKPSPEKTIEEPPTKSADKPEEQPVVVDKVSSNSADLNDELWQQVLETIKQKHNTLYGVVRMARPTWQDNNLTLAFAFAFHQKRINDPKHREIIATTIQELSGQTVMVNCVHDPSIPTTAIVQPEDIHSSMNSPAIESISNIFGGAELLES